mmetsp:Transcript_16301/g.45116  ORF Transcript_16301/g.45116 Transcript_16301/m.45116 type:complete len:268 (-) Transcript_16301:215-1018(-)
MSGTGDSVPDALGSREGGRNEYERALQDAEVLVSSGSDTEESVEYRDLSAGSAARRLKADHFTDFIDEVADGIGSYLHHLEDKQRGRVYDRHSPEESARWRQCVQEVHIQAHEGRQRNAKTAEAARKLLNKHLLGGSSKGGSSSCGALGPCRPPLDAPFQEPVVLPDGKPRLAFSGQTYSRADNLLAKIGCAMPQGLGDPLTAALSPRLAAGGVGGQSAGAGVLLGRADTSGGRPRRGSAGGAMVSAGRARPMSTLVEELRLGVRGP